MTKEKLCNHICYANNVRDCGNVDCADCQAKLDPLLDEYEQTIRADEREKVIDEFVKKLYAQENNINDANYGFNFVQKVINEMSHHKAN